MTPNLWQEDESEILTSLQLQPELQVVSNKHDNRIEQVPLRLELHDRDSKNVDGVGRVRRPPSSKKAIGQWPNRYQM
jgi:hypothetical protein